MVIRYYMKPAPAVDMLGAQAPALIGTWVGARIIASYMKKHKDMKLKDLLEFTDYHEMLSESNYLASWIVSLSYFSIFNFQFSI